MQCARMIVELESSQDGRFRVRLYDETGIEVGLSHRFGPVELAEIAEGLTDWGLGDLAEGLHELAWSASDPTS